MKLTKAKQEQLDTAYDTLIHVCLYDRPLRDMEPYLADDVMNFGAGKKEITKTKAAFLKQIKNQKKLAAGLKMDFKIRPVLRKIINQGTGAIYTDNIVNTVWINEVENKLKFRLSFIFEYRQHKWIMVHSHTSTPDPQRSDDEVWPVEELKKRTAVLEKSLDEKIAELKTKNRELEIEAALERARTQSMLMQHSTELNDTLQVFHQQLQLLGINSDFSYLWLPDEENDKHVFWATWEEEKNNVTILKSKTLDYPLDRNDSYTAQCLADWKSGIPVHAYKLPPAEVQNYFAAWQELLSGAEKLKAEFFPDGFDYVEAFMKYGCFGIVVSRLLTEDEKQILRRFTIEFERAYTRFLDLQKAEAQAREAQIEAALERVRSRSMGMQKSEELKEVIQVVYEQFVQLNIHVEHTGFIMDYKTRDDMYIWLADKHAVPFQVSIPYFDCAHWNSFNEAKEKGIDYFANQLSFEEKNKFYQDLFKLIPGVPEETLEYYFSCPGLAISTVLLENVGLYIENFSGIPYTYEENNTLMRFGKVFQQTYTRFLDLQKAEAQAREAQIELAVERVRAKALAMHNSEEITGVARILRNELGHLNIEGLFAATIYLEQDDGTVRLWDITIADNIIENGPKSNWDLKVRLEELHPRLFIKRIWGSTEKYFVVEQSEQDFPILIEWICQFKKEDAEEIERTIKENNINHTWFAGVQLEHGRMSIELFVPPPKEAESILSKIGAAFDLAYKRFLDLQKAEAQAREAQIELGLERVRARAMAMQKSDELKELIGTVHTELTKLDLILDRCFIMIYDIKSMGVTWWMSNPEVPLEPIGLFVKYHEQSPYLAFIDAWKERNLKWQYTLEGTVKKNWDSFLFVETELSRLPDFVIDNMKANEKVYLSASFNNFGCLTLATLETLSDEHFDILLRFAKVFDLTYTRLNDLQKAEAQAREAKIELGLERVRARAMAMQKSDELSELVDTVFKELTKLDFALTWCIINIIDESSLSNTVWAANPDINKAPESYHMLFEDYPFHHAMMKGWKERQTKYVYTLEGSEKKIYDDYLFSETEFRRTPEAAQAASRAMKKYVVSFSFSNFGGLQTVGDVPLSDANLDILRRFGKVFDLTYTRFNDLKQAEAQAKESQIQLALERVRARTMAMQRSDELMETAVVLFDQLNQLGENIERTIIGVMNEEERVVDVWATRPGGSQMDKMQKFPIDEPVLMQKVYGAWRQQKKSIVIDLQGEELESYFKFLKGRSSRLTRESFGERRVENFAFFSKGILGVISADPNIPANVGLYERFATVFEQTYTRFLDLQKAEAQAREAKIEAALERVRSRAMAMHKTDELLDAAELVAKELSALGINSMNVSYAFVDEDEKYASYYSLNPVDGKIPPFPFVFPHTETEVMRSILSSWKKQEPFNLIELDEEATLKHQTWVGEHILNLITKKNIDIPFSVEAFLAISPKKAVIYSFNFTNGYLFNIGEVRLNKIQEEMVLRFTKVFEMTYRRFLDLKNAEAQVREAKIETALEKVRSRTMAMQHSDELKDAANLLFHQVKELGIPVWSCGYNIWDEDRKAATVWMSSEGTIQPPFKTPLTEYPTFIHFYEAAQRGESLFIDEIGGEVLKAHYRYMLTLPGVERILENVLKAGFSPPEFQVNHAAFFSYGYLLFITHEPYPEAHDIFKRFAVVFEQTYTRFLDLQKAEAQTIEAVKQASVDRIRAEIASMRTTNDLQRIQPLIWNELTTLGVPFTRCGVFIMDEEHERVDTFLSTPEGRSIASFTSNYSDVVVISEALPFWRRKEIYKTHWDEANFLAQAKTLLAQGNITSTETYLTEHRPKDLYLHFLPFLQGILYVGNETPLNDEELQLVQNLADAFSIAYARYEDFNKLESAKEQIEKTLVDLKQAQSQLIQSEKMASLGELTAGIAHEIQNPLNFVNNFSEVNTELLVEMKDEMDKGNVDEAKTIANDVIANQGKINHHGKRADAIVKGMLQHSRSSSGVKEPTDINTLADEYLRLAYHGLRAKDNSFNATLKTDFDETIRNINIIPQDIGRVILNLITNAFYAVTEKKKQAGDGYAPTVSVNTKKINDKIEIKVHDNGNGIPQKVLDKIFQPFFTTKPTGQGTGLGLSLSYDIIKAQGGELKVETNEGEFAQFIILLPLI